MLFSMTLLIANISSQVDHLLIVILLGILCLCYLSYKKTQASFMKLLKQTYEIAYPLNKDACDKNYRNLFMLIQQQLNKQKASLQLRDRQIDIVTLLADDFYFEYDVLNHTICQSKSWEEKYDFDEFLCGQLHQIIHPDDHIKVIDFFTRLRKGEYQVVCELRVKRKDQAYHYERAYGRSLKNENDEVIRIIGRRSDIDMEYKEKEKLKHQAQRDPLTGVLNKRAAMEKIKAILKLETHGALFVIDVDDFKMVNDHCGHLFGDMVLSSAADIMATLFRKHDVIGRIGGDEFIIYMRQCGDVRKACHKASQLEEKLEETLHHRVSLSIGIAMYPEHGKTYEELMEHGDQAMYAAKRYGKDTFMLYQK